MRRKFNGVGVWIALAGACGVALCQDAGPASKLAFSAADIHPAPAGLRMGVHMARSSGPLMAGGLFQMRNATMLDMISAAYGIDNHKVSGGPQWWTWTRFDINAIAPADTSAESQKAMLRALLVDRFKLVSHTGKQPVNTWVLSASQAHKMTRAEAGGANCEIDNKASVAPGPTGDPANPVGAPLRTYNCADVSMSDFAAQIATLAPSYLQGISIVDQTGLTGGWTFRLTLTPMALAAARPGGITLEAALKQLGLGLALKPVPADVLIVDTVNETPTPNDARITKVISAKFPDGFEVASIRSAAPVAAGPLGTLSTSTKVTAGGGITYRNVFFSALMEQAFVDEIGGPILTGGRIIGVPETLLRAKFDILATAPGRDTPATNVVPAPLDNEVALRRLKKLLVERFGIQYHTEIRELDGFRLSVTSAGKVKIADPIEPTQMTMGSSSAVMARKITFQAISMPELAELLLNQGLGEAEGLPIVDGTGLAGRYDLTLDFNPLAGAPAAAANPQLSEGNSLSDALRIHGLGLRKGKVPVKVLVVDHVNLAPTDN